MIKAPRTLGHFGFWFLCGAFVLCAGLIKPVQDRVDARFGSPLQDSDVLYFTSPRVVKTLALGYDPLLADVYWMRSVQYYGRREQAARRPIRYKNLALLLDITTTLDSKLIDAYRFGSSFLAEADPIGAGQPLEAIRLLDKGIAVHPLEWRLYFDKGFVCFWFLKDFRKAAEVWLSAGRLSTSPPWMEGLAATALSRGGAVETARSLWQRQYQESTRMDLRENAKNHLDSIQVDENVWALEFFVQKYFEGKGARPVRLEDLVRAALLKYIPNDPSGTPYQYDPTTGKVRLSPASRVRYLAVPYDYRSAYLEKLERLYHSRGQ